VVIKVDVVKGVAAGAVGVWAMDVATWAVYRRQSLPALLREKKTRPFGKDPAHAAAERLRRLTGTEVQEEPNALGITIHYQLGMAPAVAYTRLRRRMPWLRAGRGALYGSLLYVLNDEVAGRVLGIMGPQRDYPWQAHVRGLIGHVVLGVVTEATLNVLEQSSPVAGDAVEGMAGEGRREVA
jgi:hypothetical protein